MEVARAVTNSEPGAVLPSVDILRDGTRRPVALCEMWLCSCVAIEHRQERMLSCRVSYLLGSLPLSGLH